MKALLVMGPAAVAILASAIAAMAQVSAPGVGNPYAQPYGPGFNGGVVIGRQDGCRNYNCPPGQYQNRPAHRRYYDHYFDVPTPDYSQPGRIGGNRAFGGAHLSDTRPATIDAERHHDWCAGRYRSYRPSDNSFQPFSGDRRQCLSPFM